MGKRRVKHSVREREREIEKMLVCAFESTKKMKKKNYFKKLPRFSTFFTFTFCWCKKVWRHKLFWPRLLTILSLGWWILDNVGRFWGLVYKRFTKTVLKAILPNRTLKQQLQVLNPPPQKKKNAFVKNECLTLN